MTDASPRCGLLVVDDHGIVREGLVAMLNKQHGLQVLGSAASGKEAILEARRLKPSIIIMDLVLPDLGGIPATERILASLPATRVIILSAHHTVQHVYRAFRAGAHGYVVKDAPAEELLQAIHAVRDGKRFLSPQATPANMDSGVCFTLRKSPLETLSGRERDVLQQIVAGRSSSDIAAGLALSRKTVDTYRGRLMAKLGVADRSALIRFAIENESTV